MPLSDELMSSSLVFDKLRLQVLDKIMPLNLTKGFLDSLLRMPPEPCDLTYAYNHISFRPSPWIAFAEWGHILVGRDLKYFSLHKKTVERKLAAPNCKGVIIWTEEAKKSLHRLYSTDGFEQKIHVIPPAVSCREQNRDYTRIQKILFVGSIDTPEDFEAKGGFELLEAYRQIRRRHPCLELTIRARAPDDVQNNEGVRVLPNLLTREELDREFRSADLFVLPSHYAHEMVVLEAMSWGLPVITSWIAKNDSDGDCAIVPVNRDRYIKDGVLVSETVDRLRLHKSIPPQEKQGMVCALIEHIERLIADASLRMRMGSMAYKTIANGQHSIGHRNSLLAKVLEGCLCG